MDTHAQRLWQQAAFLFLLLLGISFSAWAGQTKAAHFAASGCATEATLVQHEYLGACGYTQSTSFTLSQSAYVTRMRIWYDASVGGSTLTVNLTGPGGFALSGSTQKGNCQGSWCEGMLDLNRDLQTGTYTLSVGSSAICANPSGATTVIVYGCQSSSSGQIFKVDTHASGDLSSLTLSADLYVNGSDIGKQGAIFLGARVVNPFNGSEQWFLNGAGAWMPWYGGYMPPWYSGILLASTSISIVDHMDVRIIAGTEVYLGYGMNADDMLARNQVALAYTIGSATPPPASQQVQPSTFSQTVNVGDVAVTIPGGLLTQPATLTVATNTSAAQQAKPMTDMDYLGAWDISLGGAKAFSQDLVLEFPYDPAKLDPNLPEGKNLWVMYWDEDEQVWSTERAEVDTSRKIVSVHTRHLSTWVEWSLRGYSYEPTYYGPFEVYYKAGAAQPRTDVASGYSMRDLAVDTLAALETARDRYQTAGFRIPSVQMKAIIGDWDSSEWSSFSRSDIYLQRSDLTSLEKLRNDSAHEYFHGIENQYFTVAGMAQRAWWMEGTPDYMAWNYAWQRSYSELPAVEDLSYFTDSPFSVPYTTSYYVKRNYELTHAYQLAGFLRYLADRKSIDIKALWDAVADGWVNADHAFRSYIANQTGGTFGSVWGDYVNFTLFDPASTMPESALATSTGLRVSDATPTASASKTLKPNYTANVLNILAEPAAGTSTRDIKVKAGANLPSDVTVELWRAAAPGGKQLRPATFVDSLYGSATESQAITLAKNEYLFAVLANNGSSQQSVTLTAETVDQQPQGSGSYSGSWSGVKIDCSLTATLSLTVSASGTGASLGTPTLYLSGLEGGTGIGASFKIPKPAAGTTHSYTVSAGVGNLSHASFNVVNDPPYWFDGSSGAKVNNPATYTVTDSSYGHSFELNVPVYYIPSSGGAREWLCGAEAMRVTFTVQ